MADNRKIINSNIMKERWKNPEWIEKMKEVGRTKNQSEESRKLIGLVSKKNWENPDYSKHMSEVHKGKRNSEESYKITGEKIKLWHKNNPSLVEEKGRKISESKKKRQFDAQKDKIIDLYCNRKMGQSEIAKVIGCDWCVINRILKDNNIQIQPQSFFMKGKPSSNKLNLPNNEIIELYNKKISPKKIADKFNCDVSVVYRVLEENNIKREKYWFSKNFKQYEKLKENENEIIDLYSNQKISAKKISDKFNCELYIIYAILEKNKVSMRSPKEYREMQITPVKDSSIELKIQKFLKDLKIEFFTHQYMRITNGYQCDILIPSTNTIIECDGNFFHCNPIKYSEDFVRFPNGDKRKAKEVWERDKARTQELEAKGYRVIRLWENDIISMDLNKFQSIINAI